MKKYIFNTSNGQKVDVFLKDNNSTNTIMFIHGFGSTHEFASSIYNLENNFNIITFDMPKDNLSFEGFVNVAREIIDNVFNGKNLIVLGHSLGAAVNLSLENHPKISKRILLAPLNPSLLLTKKYETLYKTLKPQSKAQKIKATAIKKGVTEIAKHQKNELALSFIDPNNSYRTIVVNQILDEDFMKNKLDWLYKTYEAEYIIASHDPVIPAEPFINYVSETLNKDVKVFSGITHNLFKSHPKLLHAYLNGIIISKRRLLFSKKIFQKKYFEK